MICLKKVRPEHGKDPRSKLSNQVLGKAIGRCAQVHRSSTSRSQGGCAAGDKRPKRMFGQPVPQPASTLMELLPFSDATLVACQTFGYHNRDEEFRAADRSAIPPHAGYSGFAHLMVREPDLLCSRGILCAAAWLISQLPWPHTRKPPRNSLRFQVRR